MPGTRPLAWPALLSGALLSGALLSGAMGAAPVLAADAAPGRPVVAAPGADRTGLRASTTRAAMPVSADAFTVSTSEGSQTYA